MAEAGKEEEPMEVDGGSVSATEALSRYLNLLSSTNNLSEDTSSSLRFVTSPLYLS
jgi:hypothetical protein